MIKSPNQSLNTIHRYVILFLIRAPAKGATLTWIMFLYLKKYFNPRSREGSDLFVAVKVWYPMKISIHAPAKGATYLQITIPIRQQFQSTLPRRERPVRSCQGVVSHENFNPRSREGSDISANNYSNTTAISIHAPAKGATTLLLLSFQIFFHFNPRSREGSDPVWYSFFIFRNISIHAPAKGATDMLKQRQNACVISIHAPAKGATYNASGDDGLVKISIHAPAKGATKF